MKLAAQTIYIICESHIPSDGRVLRFAQTMSQAGYKIVGFGYDKNDRSPPAQSELPLETIEVRGPKASSLRLKLMALSMVPARFIPIATLGVYWLLPERIRLWTAVKNHMTSQAKPPNIIIAKHWTALPIAMKAARRTNAWLIYDIVEISHAEHEENWKWRLIVRPVIKAIEKQGFAQADALLTIGEAASVEIKAHNRLIKQPATIRNVPQYFEAPARPTSDEAVFLYHGLAFADRNLEELIESVKYWRDGPKLVLRLTGKPSYLDSLRKLVEQHGVEKRIEIVKPVAQAKVVAAASSADVGLCLFPGFSRQKQLAEPNKFYQYVMAGLAIMSSDLANLSALTQRHGCGVTAPASTPEQIAQAVNALTPAKIDQMREKSREAAKTLCWESEGEKLLEVLETLS